MALPFANYAFTLYAYEPFSYTINKPVGSSYLTLSNDPSIPSAYFDVSTSRVIFSSTSNNIAAGTQSFVISARDPSGTVLSNSSNTVTTNVGRFRDLCGNNIAGTSYTFYKGEPISPIYLNAPFAISLPTASPILPTGLTINTVDISSSTITGTPTMTVPQSNYYFLGKATGANLGKVVSASNVSIVVSNERLLLTLSGSPIVSNMEVDTPITRRSVYAAFPPYPSGGTMRWTWSGLPDGIVVKNNAGVVQSSPFTPSDASSSLVIEGTPTLAAAQAFQAANISNTTVNFMATRTDPLPQISNNVAFTFAFGETVLFTSNVVQSTLYKNAPVNQSSNFFTAQTYFASGAGTNISDIFSVTALPTDLSLSFIPSLARSNLSGTPTVTAGSTAYTIRAINAHGKTRDTTATFSVINDTVTFVPLADTCFNFIEARPLSNALTGYYPYPITFQASSASGYPLTFDTSDLVTGIDLSFTTPTSTRLTGSSTIVTPLRNLKIRAKTSVTNVSNFYDVSYAVLNDAITFSDVSASSLAFVQNRAITPFQLTATALSERPVISYTSSNLPTGLFLSKTGAVSGTPTVGTGGTFSVTASTGPTTDDVSLTYTVTPDSILFPITPTTYTYPAGGSVSIDVNAIAYSGKTVSNYTLSPYVYDLSINSTSGLMSGILSSGVPPDPALPAVSGFAVNATAGTLDGSVNVTLTTTNSPFQRFYAMQYVGTDMDTWGGYFYYTDGSSSLGTFNSYPGLGQFPAFATDLAFKNYSTTSNTILIPVTGLTSVIGPRPYGDVLRSVNGSPFGSKLFANGESNARPYKAIYNSANDVWYMGGTITALDSTTRLCLFQSTDDGDTFSVLSPDGIGLPSRRSPLGTPANSFTNYYTVYGVAFGYSNGVFLLGSKPDTPGYPSMKRSTNGTTWVDVSGSFDKEVGNICTDGPVWVATGSSLYEMGVASSVLPTAAVTLKYSTDQGQTWNDAAGSTHDVVGVDVVYGSNGWLSSGVSVETSTSIITTLVHSSDGMNWSSVSIPGLTGTPIIPSLPEVSSIIFDSYYNLWYVYVKPYYSYDAILYSHPATGDMTTGWTQVVSGITPFSSYNDGLTYPSRIFGQRFLANGPTNVTFSFATSTSGGPIITSPTQFAYTFYQYVTINPIQVTATGTGTIYYFVVDSELPTGIRFDPITGTFSGVSVQLGQRAFNLYAKDDLGITVVTFQTNTIMPTVIRQQTGAGAWTSLVRQYTIVNAAQNSVNGRVLPATEATLGEFTRPEPPDSVSEDPACKKC